MSPAELLVECPTCHRTHAANAGCDHRDESPGCVVAAPVGPRVTTFAPAPSPIAWWVGRAQAAEAALREFVRAADDLESATDCTPHDRARLARAQQRYTEASVAARVVLAQFPEKGG